MGRGIIHDVSVHVTGATLSCPAVILNIYIYTYTLQMKAMGEGVRALTYSGDLLQKLSWWLWVHTITVSFPNITQGSNWEVSQCVRTWW